jgi:predicted ATPase
MIRCLSVPAPANRLFQPIHYGMDQRVGAHVLLARALWLQGFPDQAIAAARAGMDEAHLVGHANSICVAIADGASLIAVLAEDVADVERLAALLTRYAENHLLGVWRIYANALRGRLLMHCGVGGSGVALLRTALDHLRETPLAIRYQLHLVWYAETLAASGNPAEALTAIDEALQRAERTEERWYLPELLRLRGEFLRATGQPDAAVEGHFRQALDWARRQGALSWELRAATSLAQLMRDQGRPAEAMALLGPVYDRFTEGFETTDLKAAKALLDALR